MRRLCMNTSTASGNAPLYSTNYDRTPSPEAEGALTLEVLRAENLKARLWPTLPYCLCLVAGKRFITVSTSGSFKAPMWNATFGPIFINSSCATVRFEIWEPTGRKQVGYAELALEEVRLNGKVLVQLDVHRKSRVQGTLHVRASYAEPYRSSSQLDCPSSHSDIPSPRANRLSGRPNWLSPQHDQSSPRSDAPSPCLDWNSPKHDQYSHYPERRRGFTLLKSSHIEKQRGFTQFKSPHPEKERCITLNPPQPEKEIDVASTPSHLEKPLHQSDWPSSQSDQPSPRAEEEEEEADPLLKCQSGGRGLSRAVPFKRLQGFDANEVLLAQFREERVKLYEAHQELQVDIEELKHERDRCLAECVDGDLQQPYAANLIQKEIVDKMRKQKRMLYGVGELLAAEKLIVEHTLIEPEIRSVFDAYILDGITAELQKMEKLGSARTDVSVAGKVQAMVASIQGQLWQADGFEKIDIWVALLKQLYDEIEWPSVQQASGPPGNLYWQLLRGHIMQHSITWQELLTASRNPVRGAGKVPLNGSLFDRSMSDQSAVRHSWCKQSLADLVRIIQDKMSRQPTVEAGSSPIAEDATIEGVTAESVTVLGPPAESAPSKSGLATSAAAGSRPQTLNLPAELAPAMSLAAESVPITPESAKPAPFQVARSAPSLSSVAELASAPLTESVLLPPTTTSADSGDSSLQSPFVAWSDCSLLASPSVSTSVSGVPPIAAIAPRRGVTIAVQTSDTLLSPRYHSNPSIQAPSIPASCAPALAAISEEPPSTKTTIAPLDSLFSRRGAYLSHSPSLHPATFLPHLTTLQPATSLPHSTTLQPATSRSHSTPLQSSSSVRRFQVSASMPLTTTATSTISSSLPLDTPDPSTSSCFRLPTQSTDLSHDHAHAGPSMSQHEQHAQHVHDAGNSDPTQQVQHSEHDRLGSVAMLKKPLASPVSDRESHHVPAALDPFKLQQVVPSLPSEVIDCHSSASHLTTAPPPSSVPSGWMTSSSSDSAALLTAEVILPSLLPHQQATDAQPSSSATTIANSPLIDPTFAPVAPQEQPAPSAAANTTTPPPLNPIFALVAQQPSSASSATTTTTLPPLNPIFTSIAQQQQPSPAAAATISAPPPVDPIFASVAQQPPSASTPTTTTTTPPPLNPVFASVAQQQPPAPAAAAATTHAHPINPVFASVAEQPLSSSPIATTTTTTQPSLNPIFASAAQQPPTSSSPTATATPPPVFASVAQQQPVHFVAAATANTPPLNPMFASVAQQPPASAATAATATTPPPLNPMFASLLQLPPTSSSAAAVTPPPLNPLFASVAQQRSSPSSAGATTTEPPLNPMFNSVAHQQSSSSSATTITTPPPLNSMFASVAQQPPSSSSAAGPTTTAPPLNPMFTSVAQQSPSSFSAAATTTAPALNPMFAPVAQQPPSTTAPPRNPFFDPALPASDLQTPVTAQLSSVARVKEVSELFQQYRRSRMGPCGPRARGAVGHAAKGGAAAGENSLMNEFLGVSQHRKEVEEDIAIFGPMVQELSQRVNNFKAASMEQVVKFVSEVEQQLNQMRHEHDVLKHYFNNPWPGSMFDTLKQASKMHQELQRRKRLCKEWQCKGRTPQEDMFTIKSHYDALEKDLLRLRREKDDAIQRFEAQGIPWDDSSIQNVKVASLNLVRLYLERSVEYVKRLEAQLPPPSDLVSKVHTKVFETLEFLNRGQMVARGLDRETTEIFNNRLVKLAGKYHQLKSAAA